jgi:nitroimidazol reductase NimA-like FMN-containing flavoprotein (pyridoxamine 5'-phosphate oxidase superfamily)
MGASPDGGLPEPIASAPRMFGGTLEPQRLPWRWAAARLESARTYWIATTRPDGRPHARPVWGVWLDNAFYFSTGSLAVRNLAAQPAITVHLESGTDVVIVEGVARPLDDHALLQRVVTIYNEKYQWDLDASAMTDPFFVVRPEDVFGWVEDSAGLDGGAAFHSTATRWRFERQE